MWQTWQIVGPRHELTPSPLLPYTHTHTQLQCRFDSSNLKWCPGKRPPFHCLLLSLTGTGLYCWCHKVAWDFKGVMERRRRRSRRSRRRAAPPADILLRSHYLSASIWTSLNELMQFKTLDICTHISSSPPARPCTTTPLCCAYLTAKGVAAAPCRAVPCVVDLNWAELSLLFCQYVCHIQHVTCVYSL